MATVVVVHADPETRDLYAAWLREEGYDVVTCGGPEPPDYFCPVLKFCGCIECEQSDMMLYDPRLASQRDHPASERIIYRLREWYPDKPVLIVSRDSLSPGLVRLVAEDVGVTVIGEATPKALAGSVRAALLAVGAAT